MIVEKVVTQTPYISIDLAYQIVVVLTVISIASFCIRMKREDLVYIEKIFISIVCMALSFVVVVAAITKYETTNYVDVPLSKIDSKIKVENEKVSIEPLGDDYRYRFEVNKFFAVDNNRYSANLQIFKFETDEFYNKSYLINSDHNRYDLSEEDANYLKSKQAKGEK